MHELVPAAATSRERVVQAVVVHTKHPVFRTSGARPQGHAGFYLRQGLEMSRPQGHAGFYLRQGLEMPRPHGP